MANKKAESNSRTTPLLYIRTIYLSLGAIIGLICFVIGASGAIKLVLNVWYPVDNYSYYSPYQPSACDIPNAQYDLKGIQTASTPRTAAEIADCEQKLADSQEKQQKSEFNRQISESVALTIVGLPIWLFHFWLIQIDWKKRKQI